MPTIQPRCSKCGNFCFYVDDVELMICCADRGLSLSEQCDACIGVD